MITFLQRILALVKASHYRRIRRHTQRFCQRAARRSANEYQKRLLLVSAIAAEELIAALLGFAVKNPLSLFGKRDCQQITKAQAARALRLYASTLLILLGSHKEQIFHTTRFTEQELLQVWCWVFEYCPEDMQLFDQVLLPAYGQYGLSGLVAATGQEMTAALFPAAPLDTAETAALEDILIDDLTAIIRNLDQRE